MKLMTDGDVNCVLTLKGFRPLPALKNLVRFVESETLKRAAAECDRLAARAGTADEAADAIRAMAKGE